MRKGISRRLFRPGVALRAVLLAALALGWGLTPGAGQPAQAAPPEPVSFQDGVVLVGFQADVTDDDAEAIEQEEGTVRLERLSTGTHVVRVENGRVAEKVESLKLRHGVRYAEPNFVLHSTAGPNDPSYPLLWGLKNTGQAVNGTYGTSGADIKAEPAWSITAGSSSVVVGVIDSGVDYNHPDLAANSWSNPGGVGGCLAATHGYNAIKGACDPLDDYGHGTHVAGTIGATGNNSAGVAGVNWNSSIMGLKFLSASGSGYTSDAVKAIDFAVQARLAGVNIRVLSNSWGGGGFSQTLLDAINRAGANDMLFVAAAGNSAANVDTTPFYPCSYQAANVICVAATDQNDRLASFSNYGSTSVDLAAPGVNIMSTIPGGGYGYKSGTSMATPHVAGAAALVLSAPGQSALTVSQLKGALLNNLDYLASLAGKTQTAGRLNLCKATPGCSTVTQPTAPAAPVLSAAAGDITVHLSWTTPADGGSPITAYRVYRTTAGGAEALQATLGVTNSYDDAAVVNGTTYYYRVSAANAVGEGAKSNQVAATPSAGSSPSAPRSLNATRGSGGGVDLAWNPPSSSGSGPVTGYRIYRSTSAGTETYLATVGNVTRYHDTTTTRGATYYYKVTAVNAFGESPPSNEDHARAR